jgi:16S rRNA (adenine1518-N6/adenine1519-N6)-dimethyltransferase
MRYSASLQKTAGHLPKKRFGQNFLVDERVIAAIIDAIAPGADDMLVEIGPGLGALTEPLLMRLQRLHVVEIDRDLIARLKARYAPERLIVHEGDALDFDFGALTASRCDAPRDDAAASAGHKLRVTGNLPYNISTPILFHLANYADTLQDLHFMLQKEVVDRMVAAPGTAAYGRLSVMLQARFWLEALFDVPPDAFMPPPRVFSAIVRLVPRTSTERVDRHHPAAFAKLVTAAFSQRRKMLRNTLKNWFTADGLRAADIDPAARAEDLSPEDFSRLLLSASACPAQ